MGQGTSAMMGGAEFNRGTAPVLNSDDPAEITQEIDQTRAEMTATVDAIQEKLNPQQATDHAKEIAEQVLAEAKVHAQELIQEAGEHAREAVRDATAHVQGAIHDATIGRVQTMVRTANYKANVASESFLDTIKQNPIPAALAGIGLGWLWMNRKSASSQRSMEYPGFNAGSQSRYSSFDTQPGAYGAYGTGTGYDAGHQHGGHDLMGRVGSSVGSAAEQVSGTASNVAGQVTSSASQFAGQVGDTASQVASQVSDTASSLVQTMGATASGLGQQAQLGAERVEDRFQSTLRTNPLAVGAVALALGTAVGLALPQTEPENALMGDTRDSLLDKAQDLAQETMGKVQDVAGEIQTTVEKEAEKQGLTASSGTGVSKPTA